MMHCMARFWYSGLRISGLALGLDNVGGVAVDGGNDALAVEEVPPVRLDG